MIQPIFPFMPGALGIALGAVKAAAAGGDPSFASVVCLAAFDGADAATSFSDESPSAHGAFTFTSDAQLDTAQKKFGTASLLLDGNQDRVSLANSDDWDFGAGKFTVEGFIRIANLATNAIQELVNHWDGSGQKTWAFGADVSGNNIQFVYTSNGSTETTIAGAFTWVADTWYHIVVDRDASDDIRLYVDGVVKAGPTATAVTLFDSTADLEIGAVFGTNNELDGWIDELRITKGVARYGGAFTPPTEAFPRS